MEFFLVLILSFFFLQIAPRGMTHVQPMMYGSCANDSAMKAAFIWYMVSLIFFLCLVGCKTYNGNGSLTRAWAKGYNNHPVCVCVCVFVCLCVCLPVCYHLILETTRFWYPDELLMDRCERSELQGLCCKKCIV